MLFTKVSVLICRTEKVKSISDHYHAVRIPDMKITVRAQLFKTNDFVSSGINNFLSLNMAYMLIFVLKKCE